MNFTDRCNIAAGCLPKAGYREMLEKLHNEMLAVIAAGIAPVVDHACTTSAVVDRAPLTDWQVDQMLDRERMKWKTSPPTHEFAAAFARAIEAAHGIAATKGKP